MYIFRDAFEKCLDGIKITSLYCGLVSYIINYNIFNALCTLYSIVELLLK